MDIISGNLNKVNNLEGSLNLDMELTGALSTVDSVLTGELTADDTYKITGDLSMTELSLGGELTIPSEVSVENYYGEYVASSKPFESTVLKTGGLRMTQDIIIEKIPYYETSNESGYTVYIGGE